MRDEPNVRLGHRSTDAHGIPRKVLVALDSRTVAMEVGIRQGVCNNSPAEATSPENGWRSSVSPIPDRRMHEVFFYKMFETGTGE